MKLAEHLVNTEWQRWFAWYPVQTEYEYSGSHEIVWLETVEWYREAYPRGLGTVHYRRIIS